MSGWAIGWTLGVIVVLAVVALVVPIMLLAHRIGKQASAIDSSLQESVTNTAALGQLNTTIEHALTIIDGLKRGRARLGG
jgi:ABC-type multidrug transport system fused ATPase/permease subunit